jgi:cytochrome c
MPSISSSLSAPLAGLLAALAISPAVAAETGQLLKGRIAFLRCAACHGLKAGEPDKVGPNLRGAIGAAAAQAKEFAYTNALRRAGLRWDDATLRRWIAAPSELVPGTAMAYVNELGEADIEALIAYLKSEVTKP